MSDPTDQNQTPVATSSKSCNQGIPFEESPPIDDLWEFDRIQSEHRDKVRSEWEDIVKDQAMALRFICLTPMVTFPTKNANYVLPQQLPLMCFRGQKDARWPLFPSVARSRVDGEEGIFAELVKEMRIQEFGKMMENTNRYRQWTSVTLNPPDPNVRMARGLYFDYRSLAQHFFVPTERLDLTNDPEVALFFACTQYIGSGRFRPLDEDETRNIGHGSIFYSPVLNSSNSKDFHGVSLIPVQPYVRPSMQSGFSFIEGERDTDLGICRHKFAHDAEFSRYICEKFGNGDILFKEKGIEWIPGQVDSILASRTFSKTAFVRACRRLGVNHRDSKRLLKELESHGNYSVGKNGYTMPDSEISRLEPNWSLRDYMVEIGMNPNIPCIKTAFWDKGGTPMFTNEIEMAGILGLVRNMYVLFFKHL